MFGVEGAQWFLHPEGSGAKSSSSRRCPYLCLDEIGIEILHLRVDPVKDRKIFFAPSIVQPERPFFCTRAPFAGTVLFMRMVLVR